MHILFSFLFTFFSFPASGLFCECAYGNNEIHAATEKPLLLLGVGEQRYLYVQGLLKYSLGSSIVRAISLEKRLQSSKVTREAPKNSLLLKAIAPGSTDLWVWKEDGTSEFRTIRVEKKIPNDKNPALEKALSRLNEIEIIYSGKGAILRGEILSIEEAAKISAISGSFPNEIHNETLISEDLLDRGHQLLEKWLIKSNLQESLHIERMGQNLWIRGHLDRPSQANEVSKNLHGIFPLSKLEIDTLPDYAPTVHFKVILLELKKSQFKTLGLEWPTQISSSFHVTEGAAQNSTQIDFVLHQLEGTGNAKILSHPELVVRAPGEAELFAGGEIPIQMQSRYFSNISWKNYGLTLKLKVTHCAGNRVRLDIFTEVSHLDLSHSVEQVPGVQANRMKTQVDAQFGVPLFLSGLLQRGVREEAKGLPFLKNIPVLGHLFGSEDYLNERSELVAILCPSASPPRLSQENITRLLPRGPIPIPRNWIDPTHEEILKNSDEYPWNAFQ